MNSADKQAVLHCLKSMIDEEVCEECPLYGITGTDHCEKDCVRLAINALEQEPKIGCWEWNQYDANPKIGNFHCSLCHSIGRACFDYCPYCGAKMSEIPTGVEVRENE